MATKSIAKNINIQGRRQCLALTRALEQSKATSRPALISKTCSELSRDQIREIFKGAPK